MSTANVVPLLRLGPGRETEMLAFKHSITGCQRAKGGVETGEPVEEVAIREFAPEPGRRAVQMNRGALLIDLDGVIRRWPADDTPAEESFGLPPGVIRSTAFEPVLLDQAITGRLSDGQWRAIVAATLQEAHPASKAHEAVTAWSRPVGRIDQGVVGALQRLRRRGVVVVLVTNATSRLDADLAALGLTDQIDAIVNSSRVGVAKPAAGIFLAALAAAGSTASDAVFVDDQQVNVDAARSMGIRSHRFQDATTLNEYLAAAWPACGDS